jgi:hypothetical protein
MNRLSELALSAKDNSKIIDSLRNTDGLIPTSEFKVKVINDSIDLYLRRFPTIEIFPYPLVSSVIPILYNNSSLWKNSLLDVYGFPIFSNRATIFGVPLIHAFKEVPKKGVLKSHFALLDGSFDPTFGVPADLLLHVSQNIKEGSNIREIEIWEDVLVSSEVFYGHTIVDYQSQTVSHLDCATMHFSPQQKIIVFQSGIKEKGISYKKHFRVDGKFSLNIAIDLMRAYFPIEELFNEAMGYEVIP